MANRVNGGLLALIAAGLLALITFKMGNGIKKLSFRKFEHSLLNPQFGLIQLRL